MTRRALLVIDVQNDFCEGGSLPVAGGARVAGSISTHLGAHRGDYAVVVGTRDWHRDPGVHFADQPDFVDTWPVHCAIGTTGAESHPDLATGLIDAWFHKGEFAAAYSGFEGYLVSEAPEVLSEDATAMPSAVRLADWLRDRGVEAVDVVGIATDHCVRATALDAVREGFATRVLLDLTAGVAPETTEAALVALRSAGAELLGSPALGG